MLRPANQKVVRVPLPIELLDAMNLLSQERGEPLEVLIKKACAEYVASARNAEMDLQYIESSGRSVGEAGELACAPAVSENWPVEDDWS